MKMNNNVFQCVICKELVDEWGNNAEPVANGKCCDECNNSVVISARLAQIYGGNK